MEKEQNLRKRVTKAGRDLCTYWRLALKFHEPHYFVAGIRETAKDFIAGKDTMLETTSKQPRELQEDTELKVASDQSPYIQ